MPPKAALKGPVPGQPAQPALKVFGNFFIPEMRTVCALLDLNEVPYQCDTIDIFSKEGREEY
jgi:hypothetical protein